MTSGSSISARDPASPNQCSLFTCRVDLCIQRLYPKNKPTSTRVVLCRAFSHSSMFSRGNKCHSMAKSFLREKTEPTIFGIWPVAYSEASITSSEKRTPFFKLFNVRTSLFCCFQKRLTLNLEEKANRLKIFIGTIYVLAIY